jgi:hypothetical protein
MQAERARTAALGREVAAAKDGEQRARSDVAVAEQRAALLDKQAKALGAELEDKKAAVVRAEVALQSVGGGGGGDVAAGIAAMQKQLLDAHSEQRAQGKKIEELETARSQALAACSKVESDLHVCRDNLGRSEREVAEHTAALASERAASHRFRMQVAGVPCPALWCACPCVRVRMRTLCLFCMLCESGDMRGAHLCIPTDAHSSSVHPNGRELHWKHHWSRKYRKIVLQGAPALKKKMMMTVYCSVRNNLSSAQYTYPGGYFRSRGEHWRTESPARTCAHAYLRRRRRIS